MTTIEELPMPTVTISEQDYMGMIINIKQLEQECIKLHAENEIIRKVLEQTLKVDLSEKTNILNPNWES